MSGEPFKVTFSEVGRQSIDRAELLLAGFPGAFDKAVQSAMRRTAEHVRTQSGRRAKERYAIGGDTIRANVSSRSDNVKIRYTFTPGHGAEASITFAGTKIPLYRFSGASPKSPTFNTSEYVNILIRGEWRRVHPAIPAAGHQLKSTSPTKFRDAFVAQFKSGHTGIFERTGGMTDTGNDELRELMGDSLPQMIGSEEVMDKLSKDAMDKFDDRIAHEVDAILNGWR